MPPYNFIDIILLLGISQGLFLAVSLNLVTERNKTANKILSFLLLISAIMLFGRIIVYRIPLDWVWRFGILADTSIFLFGPLLYLYTRKLLFDKPSKNNLHWYHYVLAVAHLGYYLWSLSFSVTEFNELYFSGKLNLMFFIVEAIGLISFIYYWFITLRALKQFQEEEEVQLSFHQNVMKYLKYYLGSIGLFIILWAISFISTNFFSYSLPFFNYSTMWIVTPIFIYGIGYFSLRQPEIFRITSNKTATKQPNRLKDEDIQKLQKRLLYYINEEKVYLKPDITLQELSDKLNTSPNNLSWLLNQTYQVSFYDYINNYRIQEFLNKIENNLHHKHTILALAMDSGFNSKSTFNRVFKAFMETTPSQYVKKKNVA